MGKEGIMKSDLDTAMPTRTCNRRTFLRTGALSATALALAPSVFAAPQILTPRRGLISTEQGTLVFRPHFVQRGVGPHFDGTYAYASDTLWDTFHSNIQATPDIGIRISDTGGRDRFGVNVRWNVEGFGYLFLTADNAGEYYELPPRGRERELNLNYELARSRVARNRRRVALHAPSGWRPSREIAAYIDMSEGYLHDAARASGETQRAVLSQSALLYAIKAGEGLELEAARFIIERRGYREDFLAGCDARGYYQMKNMADFMPLFSDVFNFATITYVWEHEGVINNFEPEEGQLDFEYRDSLLRKLEAENIGVIGRPLFWFHTWVTPDWIREKSFDQLLKYVEQHTRRVVTYYGDRIYAWEIVNEFHDWANEVQVTPDQAVELSKLAFDVAADAAPNVHRQVNNCCAFAEYVQMQQWSGQPAKYPQRTPWQFTRDLIDAGCDITMVGQQMYFPYRDLQDTLIMTERFAEFEKPVHWSEIGAPGGATDRSVKLGTVPLPEEPHVWHRHWDEELQADWLEGMFTLGYSKPWMEAVNWFDFLDPHSYIDNGGLLRTPAGEPKAAYNRLKRLREEWETLPRLSGARPATGCTRCP
jgi:endo-1,4-beta-xylanase